MANSSVSINGSLVDTFTQSDGHHRQAIVLGDSVTAETVTVADGAALVRPLGASTATRSSVAGATANTQILAANSNRQRFMVFNQSTQTLFLAYGTAAASQSSYTVQIGPGEYFEDTTDYRGEVRGVWDGTNGNARITELS